MEQHFPTFGGAAVRAGAANAANESQNERALAELVRDYRAGRISRDGSLDRKYDSEKRSIIQ